ncbi:Olfactory receptor 7A17 [Sciurus carolinensis]|uniref:Olfactory receptor 7A17 n=1 Tax=Sciurus carolinensis TaxID=30640 RepID=A0AA41MT02_SCICA|nr:Olfactory receptor 7A17 [Sciurus carolinensis]
MEPENDTQLSEFLLLGLSEQAEIQPLIFGLFLSMHLVTVVGNLLIILATISDTHLHIPMYFFLTNMSFVDICFTSTTIPKMLLNIQTQSKAITYTGCITQMYFLLLFSGLDSFLLTDGLRQICGHLSSPVLHGHHEPLALQSLVLACWIMSVLNSLLHSFMVLRLSFCTDLEVSHFFCELNQVVHHACSKTFINDMMIHITALLLVGGPLTCILYSYSKIVSSIQKISSTLGRYKAFSTCASRLSVVSLFYCTVLVVYLSSAVSQNMLNCNRLFDVHSGHPHTEPLHLQSEE